MALTPEAPLGDQMRKAPPVPGLVDYPYLRRMPHRLRQFLQLGPANFRASVTENQDVVGTPLRKHELDEGRATVAPLREVLPRRGIRFRDQVR